MNPFAGLLGGQKAQKQEPANPRRVSMRAMKAVDLKKLSADDVLEVDEFSIGDPVEQEDYADRPEDREAGDKQQKQPQAKSAQQQQQAKMPSLRPESYGPPQQTHPTQGPAGPRRPSIPAVPVITKLPPRAVDPKFSALVALDSAKDPGVLFVDDSKREGHREEEEDPELHAAVEECIRLLFGVPGIHHVGPGRNEKGEPVIIVAAAEGFSQDSMKAVPEKVHRFPTLVALPFDLVPLRRSR